MFSLANGIYQAYFSSPHLNILIVGAQGSGKSALMERIKVTDFSTKAPKGSGVLNQYSSPLSGRDAREIFYSDGTVETDHLNGEEPEPMTPNSTSRDHAVINIGVHNVVLETPDTKRKLTEMATKQQGRFRWICPAPKRYQLNEDEEDSEQSDDSDQYAHIDPPSSRSLPDLPLPLDMDHQSSSLLPAPEPLDHHDNTMGTSNLPTSLSTARGADPPAPLAPRSPSCGGDQYHSRLESMRSVDIINQQGRERPTNGSSVGPDCREESLSDYDLKRNCRMLPLSKIRPTIGMNLCRINNICGAKCHFMDVGGRIQQLWERYYHDCDAVIFVWKLAGDTRTQMEEDDSDSDDDELILTAQQQLQILERVRNSIPDDIPFMVMGQMRSRSLPTSVKTDRMYSTSCLLPNYHNLYQALFFANAATGQGVKSAVEWIIPLAKRQQRTRVRSDVDGDKL